MTTIKDVAKYAQCSIATVSRVLNNPEMVSIEIQKRVLEAIEVLNYIPNEKAKALGSKKQNLSIGVIVPGITKFYFNEFYKGVNKVAAKHDIQIVLRDIDSENLKFQYTVDAMMSLKQQGVNGIVLSSRFISEEYDEAIERLKIPVVLVLADHVHSHLPAFKVDDVRASFDAVAYLVSRGHQHIGMISVPPTNKHAGEPRLNGYKQAIHCYNLPFSDDYVAYGNMRYEDGYSGMKKLLSTKDKTNITAVFAATDEMAIGAIRCIHDAGLRVPEDISIIGYDNLALSNMTTPKLTTVSQPFEDIAAQSIEYLIRILNEPLQSVEKGTHYLPYQIVERESVMPI